MTRIPTWWTSPPIDSPGSLSRVNRPHENCYWVEPGRLLAGEYPGSCEVVSARVKLGKILDAGVTHFLDLTEARDGLMPYHDLLPQRSFGYQRLSIRDMDVPDEASMRRILAHLHERLQAGDCVYVHCWGGIGRTGTVIGCYLVEQGLSGPQALDKIAAAWRSVAKRTRFPTSPQTDAQLDFVRRWRRAAVPQ